METKSSQRGPSPLEVPIKAASEYVALVASGVPPEEATALTGTSLKSVTVKARMQELRALYEESKEDLDKIVKGRMIEVLFDPKAAHSEAVQASRVLIQDPALGFNQTPAIQLNFSNDVLSLPGVPKFKDEGEGK